jgi:hypothetical protein
MVTFLQWVAFLALAVAFLAAAVSNYPGLARVFLADTATHPTFLAKYSRGIKAMLWGGTAGMLACLVSPLPIAQFWYVPILLDPGCGPLLAIMVVSFVAGYPAAFRRRWEESQERKGKTVDLRVDAGNLRNDHNTLENT